MAVLGGLTDSPNLVMSADGTQVIQYQRTAAKLTLRWKIPTIWNHEGQSWILPTGG